MQNFKALVLTKEEEQVRSHIKTLTLDDLPQGDVLIKVHYSGINYKDSLASIPNGNIVKAYPFVPGIDLAGTVVTSDNPRFKSGDKVIATSYEIGVSHYGGYSEYARIPADWIVPLPDGLTLKEAMIIGTAGFTAALSVKKLIDSGLKPQDGPVLVTGATGGVGSFAVSILSTLGYEVAASSGKSSSAAYLTNLGATTLLTREDVYNGKVKALAKGKWAAAVDSVGGETLASVLSQLQYGGSVAASGLTAGTAVPTTVFPFILRGVNLLGIDSVYCPMSLRNETWMLLATTFKPYQLEDFIQEEISLNDVPNHLPTLLEGKAQGRILIKL